MLNPLTHCLHRAPENDWNLAAYGWLTTSFVNAGFIVDRSPATIFSFAYMFICIYYIHSCFRNLYFERHIGHMWTAILWGHTSCGRHVWRVKIMPPPFKRSEEVIAEAFIRKAARACFRFNDVSAARLCSHNKVIWNEYPFGTRQKKCRVAACVNVCG